jgi:hypothetical protein
VKGSFADVLSCSCSLCVQVKILFGGGGVVGANGCPRRLLGHRGAWLEERFPNMNEGNEITIKWI